jgi:hypothetical protein
MRKWYRNEEMLDIYQQRVIGQFVDNPLVSFVEALRNYCVHQSPIGIVTHHKLQDSESPNETFIHKESLLEWSGFSKKAKEYALSYDQDIPLMRPILDYHDKVVVFGEWLLKELKAYHSKEIRERKWYLQAIRFAEEGNFEMIFRSGGMGLSKGYFNEES